MLSVFATTPKENSSEAPFEFLVAPAAFVLAFLLFGAPAAPATDIVPTVNGMAYASYENICYGGYGPDGYCRHEGHSVVHIRPRCYDYLFMPIIVVHGYLHSKEIAWALDNLAIKPICWSNL